MLSRPGGTDEDRALNDEVICVSPRCESDKRFNGLEVGGNYRYFGAGRYANRTMISFHRDVEGGVYEAPVEKLD